MELWVSLYDIRFSRLGLNQRFAKEGRKEVSHLFQPPRAD